MEAYYDVENPSQELMTVPQETVTPNVTQTNDDAVAEKYRQAGYLVVSSDEAYQMSLKESQFEGLGGFWGSLWGVVSSPFKYGYKAAKWVVVQPIHGFKWVFNKTKGIFELQQDSGGGTGGTSEQPAVKAGLMETITKNPLYIIGGLAVAFVLYKMYKHEPLPFIGGKK